MTICVQSASKKAMTLWLNGGKKITFSCTGGWRCKGIWVCLDSFRAADESLRSMNPEAESLLFWRFSFMNPAILESQLHESPTYSRFIETMGFMTLSSLAYF